MHTAATITRSSLMTRTLLLGGAVSAVLLLSACAPDAAAPASGTKQSVAPSESAQPASATDVDTHFLAMMTPHHVQAVEMSDIVLAASGVTPETLDVAERIRLGQQEEIDTMMAWVADWGLEPLMAQHAGHIANGMVTPERMSALAALSGAEIERTFLEEMIAHHEGALLMTQDQIDNGGYPELVSLAQQMMHVQTAEISEMKALLER